MQSPYYNTINRYTSNRNNNTNNCYVDDSLRDTAQTAVYFNRLHQFALNDFIYHLRLLFVCSGGEVAKKMISCKLT